MRKSVEVDPVAAFELRVKNHSNVREYELTGRVLHGRSLESVETSTAVGPQLVIDQTPVGIGQLELEVRFVDLRGDAIRWAYGFPAG